MQYFVVDSVNQFLFTYAKNIDRSRPAFVTLFTEARNQWLSQRKTSITNQKPQTVPDDVMLDR